MKTSHRSANGKFIDMDNLRLQNENIIIAVGNMKINARGDEIGAGGQVVRPKHERMNEYYKLNTPMASDFSASLTADNDTVSQKASIMDDYVPPAEPMSPSTAAKLKGDLANKFAKKV